MIFFKYYSLIKESKMWYFFKLNIALIIFIFLLLNPSITHAQEKAKKPIFSIGVKVGPTFTGISSNNYKTKSGLYYAILLSNEIYMSDSFSLEIGIGSHNSKFTSGGYEYSMSYVTTPILLKYYFTSHAKSYGIWAGLGFEPRYKSFAKGFGGTVNVMSATEGGLFAIGGSYKTSENISVVFDLRYYMGLSKAFETDIDKNKGYLREFTFYAGVAYTIF